MKGSAAVALAIALFSAGQAGAALIGQSGTAPVAEEKGALAGCPGDARLNLSQQFFSTRSANGFGSPGLEERMGDCPGAGRDYPVSEAVTWAVDLQSRQLVDSMGPLGANDIFDVAIELTDMDWMGPSGDAVPEYAKIQDDIGISNAIFTAGSLAQAFEPPQPRSTSRFTIIGFRVSPFPIPEPGSLGLLGMGLAWVVGRRLVVS